MNNSIVYVGLDVHKESFSICCYTFEADKILYQQKIPGNYKYVLRYIEQIRRHFPKETIFLCGYEAGCLGYSLYHHLKNHGLECCILAPSTMGIVNNNHVKTDRKDAGNIAKCLAFHTYSEVYVPTKEEEAVRDYIRMKEDHTKLLKMVKQQILSLLLRQDCNYDGGSTWTIKHVKWLKTLSLEGMFQETLDEYLVTFEQLSSKIELFDKRISELSLKEEYVEKVKKLGCFIGIREHTALSFIVEVGDFKRFKKAEQFAAYLGVVPSENSSGENKNRYGITKAGNTHLRRLLTEAAQGYTKGKAGQKSKALLARQRGNSPQTIAYADRANERLKRKFYSMTLGKGKKRNVAVTAITRELACFIWGMMNDAIA